jgi:hypothetical protein
MIVGHSEREYFALVYISLGDNLIVLPIVNNQPTLVSGNIHSLVKRTPGGLCDYVILRSRNLFNTVGILVKCLLEIVDTDV